MTEAVQASSRAAVLPAPAAAAGGAVAAAAALSAGELVAAAAGSPVSLVTSVGNAFVDRFAASLKDLAVALFGTNDKVALLIGIVVTSLMFGAVLGVADQHRRWVLPVGFVSFGSVGAWALATDPQGSAFVALAAAVSAVAAGILTMRAARRAASRSVGSRPTAAQVGTVNRRSFTVALGWLAAAAITGGVTAEFLRRTSSIEAARRQTVIPRPRRRTPVPTRQPFAVANLSPYVTPTEDFYRIDTALTTPRVAADDWRLRVDGLVDRPFELAYRELLSLDSVEAPVTIACVSNEVGGRLVGNAVWQGVPLGSLLERAGVRADATQIIGRSVDGFTAGFPTAAAFDGRIALVAYAMNGEPLTAAHGFPARLVVSGLYGYVSATKWLASIELTGWDDADGYWIPRGWAKEGPIKTQSRIDVPADGATIAAGVQPIAGVAWAPHLGIDRVEVQIDDGPWMVADLGAVASADTWVQWHLAWIAAPGEHELRVRATDSSGSTQASERSRPAPDGATGWHTRRVRVA